MFYFISTKNGIGAELWGTYDDLKTIHEVVGKFWSQEGFEEKKGFDTRDSIISSFSYEIRKAFQGSRLKRESNHFTPDLVVHFGCQMSWVHLIFAMNAIRWNMRFFSINKLDNGIMLQLEYWLEESLQHFDPESSAPLIAYLNGGIDQGNAYLYQFMRSINADFFKLGGGKEAFKKLDALLQRAVKGTEEYKMYNLFLVEEARRLGGKITELELMDDDIDYDGLAW